MTSILEIEALGKQIHPPSGPWLFREMNAAITEPVTIGILGKSGQGKSTLLRILGRLTNPDNGTIRLEGKEMTHWEPEPWRMKMSYVAQHPVMLPGNIEDNLRAASFLHQLPFDQMQARQWLDQLGLDKVDWSKPAHQLSGGEKQRLALVRTLLLRPAILLLDEVTSSLDAVSKQATERLLVDLHAQTGTTLLWVTHDLDEARIACKRIWFMANGELQADTSSESFFCTPQTVDGRDFLHNNTTPVASAKEE